MDREHLVRVSTEGGWASGCTIAPRLVLTTAHLVGDVGSAVTVTPLLQGPKRVGHVRWRGEPVREDRRRPKSRAKGDVDAALVQLDGPDDRSVTGQVRWGRIVGDSPRVECRTWGFPRSARPAGDSEQVAGSINPGNGFRAGAYFVDCDVVQRAPFGDSPWEGISGAAVFCGDLLVGVVRAHHPGHLPVRLEVEPAYVLFGATGFLETLASFVPFPSRAVLEPVEYGGLAVSNRAPDPGLPPLSPVELLQPDREIVPLRGREEQLATLSTWSGQPGAGVCLVHGPGGQGKTRLVQAFCHRLSSDRNWSVLWVRPGETRRIRKMDPCATPLLVVVDGADGRVDDTAALLDFAARNQQAPVKVVLLARSQGGWTERVREKADTVRGACLLSDTLAIALPALETGAEGAEAAYRAAARAFARVLPTMPGWTPGAPPAGERHQAPPDAGDHLGSPLTLHMAALVHLLDASSAAPADGDPATGGADPAGFVAKVENQMLYHERGHWLRSSVLEQLRLTLSPDALLDVMAAVVALGPQDRSQAEAVLRRVPRLEDQTEDQLRSARTWLESVLPNSTTRLVGDLRPDRLAERFVADRFRNDRELADAVLAGATPEQAARFLTFASRAVTREILGRELVDWCLRHPDVLGRAAIDVATRTESHAPLLDALDAVVDDPATTLPQLESLAAHLPETTHVLAPWALGLSRRIVGIHRRRAAEDPESLRRFGVALRQLSTREWRRGYPNDALETVREAIGLWQRAVPLSHPDVRRELGACQHNAAMLCGTLGRRQEALDAARAAVVLLREDARSGDSEALARYSKGLSTLADAESRLGAHEAALEAVEECVEIRGSLAARSDRYRALLADGLQDLAVHHMECGHREAALTAARQAVGDYEELAAERPDAFLPGHALTLATFSSAARLMGLTKDALKAAREAVDIRRRLDKARPEVHRADLANVLNHLCIDLEESGQYDEALVAIEESVRLFRALARKLPAVHGSRLALTLNSQASMLGTLGHHERGLEAAEESVTRYEDLDRSGSHAGAFRSEIAMALLTKAGCLDGLGRTAEAREALQRAVSINRELARRLPAVHRPDLALCLNNLADVLRRTEGPEPALRMLDEALRINSELARERDGAAAGGYADVLAKNWLMKYTCLRDLARPEEALVAGGEALRRLEALAEATPEKYGVDLFAALSSVSVLLRATGQSEKALEHLRKALDTGRLLMANAATRQHPYLPGVLWDCSNNLNVLDRRAEALDAAEEAHDLDRAAAEREDTDAARLALARGAVLLGDRLSRCGRRADALRETRLGVSGLRRLNAADRDEYRPLLLSALNQSAVLLLAAGEGGAAVEAAEEALTLSRAAAGADATSDPAVVAALVTRGLVAAELERADALRLVEEAFEACEQFTVSKTVESQVYLAVISGFLGRQLTAVPERRQEAVRVMERAVGTWGSLVGALPFLRDQLPLGLAVYGVSLAEAAATGCSEAGEGLEDKAVTVTEEAVRLARLLSDEHPEAYADVLAHSLAAFARARLRTGDRSAAARSAAAEALDLFTVAARREPEATARYLREAQDTYDRLRQ
jgi:tetratricopeptide (TPR) repeat protein